MSDTTIAWESTTSAYTKYITDERYQKFSPKVRRWYKPYKCTSCAALHAKAGVSVNVSYPDGVAGSVKALRDRADKYFKAKDDAACNELMFAADALEHFSALSTKLQEPVGCQTCEGRGEIGGYQRYGDGDVDLVIEPCPDCSNESVKRVAIQQWKDISAAPTLAHQPVTAGLEKVDDMLSALRDSIHGDCYMGERWEQEQIDEIRMALAALKSEGRNDG